MLRAVPFFIHKQGKRLKNFYEGIKKKKHIPIILSPYFWLIFFFVIPFLITLKISFSNSVLSIPPFSSILFWSEESVLTLKLNLGNYLHLLKDPIYISAFLTSASIAGSSTLCCLFLGYLMAYGISRAHKTYRPFLLIFIILPFWTSFLVRVYAWMSLMSAQGIINIVLMKAGLIKAPLQMLDNSITVCLGIVYCYLPFMILPIYSSLEKIDSSYIEAAFDLGSPPWKVFWSVTVPLSMPGVIAGTILVFVPAVGEFVIPELLGGPDTLMIGRTLWWEFFNNHDWPTACALAVLIIVVFIIPVMLFQKQHLRTLKKQQTI